MVRSSCLKFHLIILCFIFPLIALADNIKPVNLKCNHVINPIGIDDLTPSLSWQLLTLSRGQYQSAYQIIVGSNPEFLENFVIWNSGKVTSSQSVQVRYNGPPLQYETRYYWKLRTWDANGLESNFSETAFWETTLDPKSWKGDWISAPVIFNMEGLNKQRYSMVRGEKNDYVEPLPLLRKQFSISKKLLGARAYVAVAGFYELYINGNKVSTDILNPAFTNYDKTVLFNTYDVTKFLQEGANTIGIMLGNGWYNSSSKEVWGFDKAPWRNYPAIKLQVKIDYEDKTEDIVVTDQSWKTAPGPITFSQVRQGEYYDARFEILHWSESNIDERKWKPVRKVGGPIGLLKPHILPPVKVMHVFSPVQSTKLANGNIVYDFGQNIAGFINIKISGKAGSRLQFKYAEKIDSIGAADQSNIDIFLADSLFQVDRYTLKGNGEEIWSPRFVYHGFRFAEVSFSGDIPQILSISAQAVHTSFEQIGEFSCSNQLINKINNSTLWSYRNNFIGFPADCPQREKNGWTGDAQLACETGLSNFNSSTSYHKWLNDLRDEQQTDGSLPGIVPTSGWGYYWGNGPAWDIACIEIPWKNFVYTGDTTFLSDNYYMMKKYVDYIYSRSPEYIADFGLGDWMPVSTKTPASITSTAYFYFGAFVVSKVAGILGNKMDKMAYEQLAEKIKGAFNKKYFNSKDALYANGSQTALSCALFFDLVPEEYKKPVIDNLVSAVHAKDDHIDCGILGARYILHVLTEYGHADLAYKIVATDTYPGWGYWIQQGATTLWEDWKGNSSLNHIMFGDVSSWFYKSIAGIRPDETYPGFKQFIIRPEIVADLSWAKAKYESVYGTIISNWRIEGKMFIHKIEIPVNSTARYYIPFGGSLREIKENGKNLRASDYTIYGTNRNRYIMLLPGKYQFSLPFVKR